MVKTVAPVSPIETKPVVSSSYIDAKEDIPLPKRYYDYFGTKWESLEFDRDGQKELNYIWNMTKDRIRDHNISSILSYVDRLSHRLGSPEVGQSRYNKIYNYLIVNNNINALLDEKKIYERKRK